MDHLSAARIQHVTRCSEHTARRLLEGVEKDELEPQLCREMNLTWTNPAHRVQIDTARMNLIGSLRAAGYIVEGGRQNRSLPYKVVGFEEPKLKQGIDVWGGEEWRFVQSLRKVTRNDELKFRGLLLTVPTLQQFWHERCWHYLWCYEMGQDTGYWYETPNGTRAIILQKNVNLPRFRIYNIDLDIEEVIQLGQRLAKISLGKIRVFPLDETQLPFYKQLFKGVGISRRISALYDWAKILERQEEILGKRGMTTFRRNDREIDWKRPHNSTAGRALAKGVINDWRFLNESKHRQLAIVRDYRSLESSFDARDRHPLQFEYSFIGYRSTEEGIHPCCLHIADGIGNGEVCTALIVEKSLNYRKFPDGHTCPGGYAGTADYNTFKLAQYMVDHGVGFMNAGTYEGGGFGLADHKKKYTVGTPDVHTYVVELPYEPVSKEKLYV